MKIRIESTGRVDTFRNVPARLWQGTTAGGVPVVVYVLSVAVEEGRDEEFRRELAGELVPIPPPPEALLHVFDPRFVH